MKFFDDIKEKLKIKDKKKLKDKPNRLIKHHTINGYLSKAGLTISSRLLSRGLFKICLAINIIITFYLVFFFITKEGYPLFYIIAMLFILWTLIFFLFLGVVWLLFYLFVDLRIFKRKLSIEDVLPDFLFLAATNIRSGMTIDQSLWSAIRPGFGVLANEIETVAKEVMSGADLTDSLEKFADKYESDVLKRSINLLVEGIKSGGEMGNLLTKIASNIRESRLIKEEISADVTSYVIFITFASVVAAPALLALSNQLIGIISSIVSGVDMSSSGSMVFAITDISISETDFKIFALVSLLITSFFSSIIVATIKKGSIKEGIKYIPVFIITSFVIYFSLSYLLDAVLGGMFG